MGHEKAGANPIQLWAKYRMLIHCKATSHTPIYICGQFKVASRPNPHIFGLWEETRVPGENPHICLGSAQVSKSGPSYCDATLLTTASLCCPTLTNKKKNCLKNFTILTSRVGAKKVWSLSYTVVTVLISSGPEVPKLNPLSKSVQLFDLQLVAALYLLTNVWLFTCSSRMFTHAVRRLNSSIELYSEPHITQTSDASLAVQGQIHNFPLPMLGNGNGSRNEKLSPDSHGMIWNICLEVCYVLHQPSTAAQKLRPKGCFMKQVELILLVWPEELRFIAQTGFMQHVGAEQGRHVVCVPSKRNLLFWTCIMSGLTRRPAINPEPRQVNWAQKWWSRSRRCSWVARVLSADSSWV